MPFGLRRVFRPPSEFLPSFTSYNLPTGAAQPRCHRGNVACRRHAGHVCLGRYQLVEGYSFVVILQLDPGGSRPTVQSGELSFSDISHDNLVSFYF